MKTSYGKRKTSGHSPVLLNRHPRQAMGTLPLSVQILRTSVDTTTDVIKKGKTGHENFVPDVICRGGGTS